MTYFGIDEITIIITQALRDSQQMFKIMCKLFLVKIGV